MGDDGDVWALCCAKSNLDKLSMCDKCHLKYSTDYIDMHTCDKVTTVEFRNCVSLCTQSTHCT